MIKFKPWSPWLLGSRSAKALRHPELILPAILGRAFRSSKWGPTWKAQGEFWTFKEEGFALADGPAMLLARQHWEITAIRRCLAGTNAETSLEIGCGYGRLSPTIAEYSVRHLAVDINEEALAKARLAYPAIDFQRASATELPVSDASQDLVVTWTVLQHIPPVAIDQALSEIRRVLKPNGTLLLCEATMYPGRNAEHIWDRESSFYERAFQQFQRVGGGFIKELESISGRGSPGEVMLFR